jgi:GT2 family glycosyltransferase
MSEPTVLTVILNYRTPGMTIESVEAALREMAGVAGEIVVVDNDSRDGSFETIGAAVAAAGWDADHRVRVVAAGRNGGYGAGNNVGIRAGLSGGGQPDYVYILNSDAFPDAGAIRRLVDFLESHPAVGFAGSYIHGSDGQPHATAFRFPTLWSEFEGAARLGPISRLLARHVVALPVLDVCTPVDWVAGASVMMRRTMLDAIGLFDEEFFLYFDETDLCRRGRTAGWSTVYVRESEVTHIGSATTGMKTWTRTPSYWFDSRLRYFVKHHGTAYAAAATVALVAGGLIWRSRMALQGLPPCDPPHFLRDLVIHAFRACKPRTRHLPTDGGAPQQPTASAVQSFRRSA